MALQTKPKTMAEQRAGRSRRAQTEIKLKLCYVQQHQPCRLKGNKTQAMAIKKKTKKLCNNKWPGRLAGHTTTRGRHQRQRQRQRKQPVATGSSTVLLYKCRRASYKLKIVSDLAKGKKRD